MSDRICVVCEQKTSEDGVEEAFVRSNVRAFRGEKFAFWRCAACRSLHARDDVDLAHYYAKYSFHALVMDWRLRLMYANQLARLRRAGVRREHRILDYGCGSGQFVRFLRSSGYSNVRGFDEYSAEFGDRTALDDHYDCIVSQDVIEHVPSPRALVQEFQRLTKPESVIAIGTPNASAIRLERAEEYVHTIHAPYHRHILSEPALRTVGDRAGWSLQRFYPTMYSNTRFPFLNEAFYVYYTRITDDTLDALMEPVRVGALFARGPVTLFWGLFGSFFSRHTDVMAIFRRR